MLGEIKSYLKFCRDARSSPLEEVVSSLKTAGKTGDFMLKERTLPSETWDIIGKMLSSSDNIRKVDFSECLIPFKGMANLLGHLSYNSSVHTLILKGNNIQAENVSCLGTMLKNNIAIKKLCLEWNSLGLCPNYFSVFCDGLSLNRTLEYVDLRNNELKPEVAEDLSRALARNRCLRYLDIRWNRLCSIGATLLLDAMQHNQSITKLKLQGNYITSDILNALDECAQRNLSHENISGDYASDYAASIKSKSRIQPLDPARGCKEMDQDVHLQIFDATVLTCPDSGDYKKPVQLGVSKLEPLESMLSERANAIAALQSQLQTAESDLGTTKQTISDLEARLAEQKQAFHNELEVKKQELDALQTRLQSREEESSLVLAEMKSKLSSEQDRSFSFEQHLKVKESELDKFQDELRGLKDNLEATQKQYDDKLVQEQALNYELLTKTEQEHQLKITRLSNEFAAFRKSTTEKIASLQHMLDAAEKAKSDLTTQLALETGRRTDEYTAPLHKALSKVALLDERVSALREEKALLEKQVAMAQSTMSQLQQQNTVLVSELAEPQRKLLQLHEELGSERLSKQRVVQELAEATAREQEHRKEKDRLQGEVEMFQRQMKELLASQEESDRRNEKELQRLQSLVAAKDREISTIRAEEVERAGHLYSAFTKYVGSFNPASTRPQMTLKM